MLIIRMKLAHAEDIRHISVDHYSDVMMGAMTSQITSLRIVYSTCLFTRRSKKASKLRVTGLCVGNSPVTGEFPAHRASNAKMFPFDDVIMDADLYQQDRTPSVVKRFLNSKLHEYIFATAPPKSSIMKAYCLYLTKMKSETWYIFFYNFLQYMHFLECLCQHLNVSNFSRILLKYVNDTLYHKTTRLHRNWEYPIRYEHVWRFVSVRAWRCLPSADKDIGARSTANSLI